MKVILVHFIASAMFFHSNPSFPRSLCTHSQDRYTFPAKLWDSCCDESWNISSLCLSMHTLLVQPMLVEVVRSLGLGSAKVGGATTTLWRLGLGMTDGGLVAWNLPIGRPDSVGSEALLN